LGRFLRSGGLYFIILLIFAIVLVNLIRTGSPDVQEMNSQEFQRAVDDRAFVTDDKEAPLLVKDEDQTVTGKVKTGDGNQTEEFEYAYPEYYEIANVFNDANIPFTTDPQNTGFWLGLLGTIGPLLIFLLLFLFLMSSMQGGGNRVMSFGKSRARRMTKDSPKVTFADVAGADEAVQELTEIKEFLESPQKFQKLGARIPKGALLVGPPGTGKTLLARAVAGEAGVPFFSISGSDFVEMFVGVGASRVRDLFEQAKQNSPCIIFMDEIDAVGRQRGAVLAAGTTSASRPSTSCSSRWTASTPRAASSCSRRPTGRTSSTRRCSGRGASTGRSWSTGPTFRAGEDPLRPHERQAARPRRRDRPARQGHPGFTGADLANLVNEAALLAARHDKDQIEMEEMEEAIDRVIAGPERKTRLISEKEKEITAFHEAGHAVVGALLPKADPVHKISIIPRGQAWASP
jgi:cell division protease FtsH